MTDVQITAELLDELDSKAKAATAGTWRAGNAYDKPFIPKYEVVVDTPEGAYVLLSGNHNFLPDAVANVAHAAAANPATILALTAHIRSLTERLEKAEKDAARYRWLRDNCQDVADEYGTAGQLYFGTYHAGRLDAAIDAALALEGADHE